MLRESLQDVKNNTEITKNDINKKFETIDEAWRNFTSEKQNEERELINRLTVDHELELNDIKKYITNKNDETEYLKADKKRLEESINELLAQHEQDLQHFQDIETKSQFKIGILEQQLEQLLFERNKVVNDFKENLIREHKTEIEALRCRFKLMTNMERSPSDTSLEKIERSDVIDLISHDSILLQTREDFEYERNMAVKEAIEIERAKWEKLTSSSSKTFINHDIYKEILEEKDRQLDMIRERERMLTEENSRHKKTIQKLADTEETELSVLRIQFEKVQEINRKFEEDLNIERSRRIDIEHSITHEKR